MAYLRQSDAPGTAAGCMLRSTHPTWMRRRLIGFLSFAILLGACGTGGGGGGTAGPAQISTLAYVLNQCAASADDSVRSFRQSLWVRQGNRQPLKVVELPVVPMPLCREFADARDGGAAIFAGAFQRMGVSPDGQVLVFEVTYDFSPFRFEPWAALPEEQEGIFTVRTDGTGLRKLAPRSAQRCFAIDPGCYVGQACQATTSWFLDFSPSQRHVVLTDRGRDPAGTTSAQVFTLDVISGASRQITDLPPLPRCGTADSDGDCRPDWLQPIAYPRFIDAETLAFYQPSERDPFGTPFTVHTDGSDLREVPRVATGSGVLVPILGITGEWIGFTIGVPGNPPNGAGPYGNSIVEAYVTDGTNVLQTTDYGRSDTQATRVTLDGGRVLFQSSANPLGSNPRHHCQWFSDNVIGGDLRQLTALGGDEPGCNCVTRCHPPSCTINLEARIDWGTGSLVFGSSCDPFGTNPTLAGQLFAMWPDGGGLRQLTFTQGVVEEPDGALRAEMVGPFAIATRYR